MTDINFNCNPNITINNYFGASAAGTRPAGDFQTQLATGIFAAFAGQLATGPFATPALPTLFNIFAGLLQQAQGPGQGGAEPSFEPQAEWSATLPEQGKAAIDLGDGYSLDIDESSSQIEIHNDNTGETTRIWGDPHVDVDGKHVYDFWGKTTFTLENGTKITIDTEQGHGNPDVYYASQLTITKGDQAIVVEGVSEQTKGDLSVSLSNDGEALDAETGDGFVLNENATGSGWRSDLTGQVATQADLDATRPGGAYGPGSDMPSLDDLSQMLSTFLFFGVATELSQAFGERASINTNVLPRLV